VVDRIWIGVIVVLAIALLVILQHNRGEDRDARRAAANRLLVEIDHHELC
jgi:preprotein translocase subunit SecG